MTRATLAASLAACALAIAACLLGNGYQVYLVSLVALTAMVGVGLNVLLGLTGQVSLGHVGFFALGAYTTAILSSRFGVDFWLTLPLAGALAGLLGIALALPALRVAGPYLAMVTIAFGFIVQNGAIEWRSLTGGSSGMSGIAPPALFGHVFQIRDIALLAVALAALLLFLFDRLSSGPWGRAMRAVRASEAASQSLGLHLVSVRVTAFALSAVAAGIAGAVFAPLSGFISPSGFSFFQSILFLLVVIVGGAGTTAGPLVGAIVVVLAPQLGASFAEYQLLFFGAVLFIVLRLAPEGATGAAGRFRRRRPSEEVAHPAVDPIAGGGQGNELLATDLTISFGGVRAVAQVSLMLKGGRITSLIGPNGAGKSTVINLLTGFYQTDGGAIALGGAPLTGLPAHAIARAGVVRTFQTSQLFTGLSVIDNVRVASRGERLGRFFPIRRGRAELEERRLADGLLSFVGYQGARDRLADDLPHVDKRLVEIARALARRPRVLLLDEPAAGLGEADKERLTALLHRIATAGIAVLLVEHDINLVMDVSDAVVVLDAGRCIAAGTPEQVQRDPVVIKAYLGESDFHAPPRTKPLPAPLRSALEVEGLRAGYGPVEVLRGVGIGVGAGEMVAILGANGAGKSTMMRALSGLLQAAGGSIRLAGEEIARCPAHRVAGKGLVLVPEGRQLFPELSVTDNLRLGAFCRRRADAERAVEEMLLRFPLLMERRAHRAGLLSGGEQQMLALARGLIALPRVLLLDEPSLGLAPSAIVRLFTTLSRLRDDGVTLLLVDQMAGMALALADRGYVLETGRIVASGTAAAIGDDLSLRRAYLGDRRTQR